MFGLFCGSSIHIVTVYVHMHVQITDKQFIFFNCFSKAKADNERDKLCKSHIFRGPFYTVIVIPKSNLYIPFKRVLVCRLRHVNFTCL